MTSPLHRDTEVIQVVGATSNFPRGYYPVQKWHKGRPCADEEVWQDERINMVPAITE